MFASALVIQEIHMLLLFSSGKCFHAYLLQDQLHHTYNLMTSKCFVNHIIQTPYSEEQQMQKVKSHVVRTQSLNTLPLKPGVGQYIATHATLTARDFFLANFYPSGPIICIFFPKPLPISPVLAEANTGFLRRPAE